jgi:hypothetical protein
MASRQRNLSQQFEKLLKRRSILELTGEEAVMSRDLLIKIVNKKPLRSLTKVELSALIEVIAESIALDLFNGNLPDNWKKQTAYWLEDGGIRAWNLSSEAINSYITYIGELVGVENDVKKLLIDVIITHLHNEKNYYDYFIYFLNAIYYG